MSFSAALASISGPLGPRVVPTIPGGRKIAPEQTEVPVLRVSFDNPLLKKFDTAELRTEVRSIWVAALASKSLAGPATPLGLSWALTLLIAHFDAFRVMLTKQDSTVKVKIVDAPEEIYRVLSSCRDRAIGNVTLTGDDVPALWDDETLTFPDPDVIIPAEVAILVAIYIFTIGKNVTPQNMAALSVNRPAAAARYLKTENTQEGVLGAARFPQFDSFLAFQGAIQIHAELRRLIATEVISWVGGNNDLNQSIVANFVGLWAGTGLTHVTVINRFLNSYESVVEGVPALFYEAKLFISDVSMFLSQKNPMAAYIKIIDPSTDMLAVSKYPELFKLAREFEARREPRMQQYAAAAGTSSLLPIFEERANLIGIGLPQRVTSQAPAKMA